MAVVSLSINKRAKALGAVVGPDPARGAHSPATMGPWRALARRTPLPSIPSLPRSRRHTLYSDACGCLNGECGKARIERRPVVQSKSGASTSMGLPVAAAIGQPCITFQRYSITHSFTVYYCPARPVPFDLTSNKYSTDKGVCVSVQTHGHHEQEQEGRRRVFGRALDEGCLAELSQPLSAEFSKSSAKQFF
ncbi:hypothetical protein PAHAL_2G401700 [Panicum hallii]|jgi:hypothetical protein|uniref:Uncharacterized protein n=1 Tax=Panicum hallii TaxID=206008 RepID=A0A2S3H318_9POAL|nr:hypothetical protein PAHAL_2G401700 [Panicum hallii]